MTTTPFPSPLTPFRASLLYLAVALVFTWPLAAGLARDIPWDLGDSLLNAWILAWDSDRLLRFLSGDVSALRNFWNANIFYPEPLTLAYSEHLFAQAVQILPVYALTASPATWARVVAASRSRTSASTGAASARSDLVTTSRAMKWA